MTGPKILAFAKSRNLLSIDILALDDAVRDCSPPELNWGLSNYFSKFFPSS
jgi:hypothetical protein